MLCQKCLLHDFKIFIKIELNLYKDYEKVKELGDIDLCIGCFISSFRKSIIDKEFDLEKIIEDAMKEVD